MITAGALRLQGPGGPCRAKEAGGTAILAMPNYSKSKRIKSPVPARDRSHWQGTFHDRRGGNTVP